MKFVKTIDWKEAEFVMEKKFLQKDYLILIS